MAYGQSLQSELEDQEHEASFSIRENWIVMKILDNARKLKANGEITSLHISSPEHVNGIKKSLESVNVDVQTLKLSKEVALTHSETAHSKEMEDLLQSMQIRVKPIIKTDVEEAPYLLFFLDTERIASPFDVCMAYDAGFNAVIPYENVTADDAKKIVQDAIFSRGPKGVKHTCFFIGGKNAVKAEEISEGDCCLAELDNVGAYVFVCDFLTHKVSIGILGTAGSLLIPVLAEANLEVCNRKDDIVETDVGRTLAFIARQPVKTCGDILKHALLQHQGDGCVIAALYPVLGRAVL